VEQKNLALDKNLRVPVRLGNADTFSSAGGVATGNNTGGVTIEELQKYLKERVLQLHHAGNGSPRPYDNELVPAVKTGEVVAGVDWKIYQGQFPWIPQTQDIKSVAAGFGPFPALGDQGKEMNRLSVFTGYISVPADGEYSFYLSCDAKAFLRIHEVQVIDADYGYSGDLPLTRTMMLKAGLHPFSLYYYRDEDKGDPFLKLDWSGPGLARKSMQKAAFFRDKVQ
jgi:hypothetical protein